MTPQARALVALAFFAAIGCRRDYPPNAQVVSDVELQGVKRGDSGELLDGLATASSSRFLGIWDGVIFDYEVFEEALLERDLERIERYYRARGYYEARVSAARVIRLDSHHVRVQIAVNEGEPVLITGEVRMPGLERLPSDVSFAAIRANRMVPGALFDEDVYESTKRDLVRVLADRGYAYASVKGRVSIDIARHTAAVVLEVSPGARARYGPVRIVGLRQVPEGPVRANLELVEGGEYSRAEVEDARAALVNLGVFATVDIKQDLSKPDSGVVPITVVVSEAPLRTLRLGGGMRFDLYEWSTRLTIGWEHRNFLGGMRKFTIETHPGVVFYPTRIDLLEPPTKLLLRNFARAELRQPAFLEGRTTGFVATEYNVYPILYPGHTPVSNENLLGYQEFKARTGVERAFFGHHLYLTPSYNFQINAPFAYSGDNPLSTAYVSYPQFYAVLDFRDDPIQPHSGVLVANTIQVAGTIFGGSASDVREQPEVRAYVPISKAVTLATRATVGFLFPFNYGGTIENGTTEIDPTDPAKVRDEQLTLLRAFFSGGPSSNRGYPFRGVGPQGILGFLLPNAGAACTDVNNPDCLRALGGFTLWEASVEARFPISGPLGMAIFVDASDVSRETANIRLDYPHLSTGIGLHYATPIGPIRFDVGYRIPYMQHVGEKDPPETEGIQSTIFGLPIAVAFALGEVY